MNSLRQDLNDVRKELNYLKALVEGMRSAPRVSSLPPAASTEEELSAFQKILQSHTVRENMYNTGNVV